MLIQCRLHTHTHTETEGIFHLCIPGDKQWAWQSYEPHDVCFQLKPTIAYLTAKANISVHTVCFTAIVNKYWLTFCLKFLLLPQKTTTNSVA